MTTMHRNLLDICINSFSNGNYEKAIELCDEILKEKYDETALIYKIKALIELDKNKEALRILKKYNTYVRNNYILLKLKGNVLVNLGSFNDACDVFSQFFCEVEKASEIFKIEYSSVFNIIFGVEDIDEVKKTINQNGLKQNSDYYLRWIDLIEKRKPDVVCPKCKSEIIPIIYGYPLPELLEKANNGEVILGGCVSNGVDFNHDYAQCENCGQIDLGYRGTRVRTDRQMLKMYADFKISQVMDRVYGYGEISFNDLNEKISGLYGDEFEKLINKLIEMEMIKIDEDGVIYEY